MNFNLYLNADLAHEIITLCKKTKKKRNTLIQEALVYYLNSIKKNTWPKEVLQHKGIALDANFESHRELAEKRNASRKVPFSED